MKAKLMFMAAGLALGLSAAEYQVIDLSGGASASSYPVSTLSAEPKGGWTDEYKTTKLVLRRIEAGTFLMGEPPFAESQRVTLTEPYYIGVFEVTQKQWELVMGKRPSYFTNDKYYASRPVEQVSYSAIRGGSKGLRWPGSSEVDATSFLGALRKKTGLSFDLPTEAQWEYACRAGTTTDFNDGSSKTGSSCVNMNRVGRYWYNGGNLYSVSVTTSGGTAKVGSYVPNAWGLYDMHGNVWEWCLDRYGTLAYGTDPKGTTSSSARVARGGCWYGSALMCTSYIRSSDGDSKATNIRGFRLARTVSQSVVAGGGLDGALIDRPIDGAVPDGWTEPTEPVVYVDADGTTTTCSDYEIVTAETTAFEDGKMYVVPAGKDIVCGGIAAAGNVHLILSDGCSLAVTGGVSEAGLGTCGTITICGQALGTGRLSATGGIGAPGIGAHAVTVFGGTVEASGGEGSVAIGTADGAQGTLTVSANIAVKAGARCVQAAIFKEAKAVVCGSKLTFVYDSHDYSSKGIEGKDWFSVADAEARQATAEKAPWFGEGSPVTSVAFDASFRNYQPANSARWLSAFADVTDAGFAAWTKAQNLTSADAEWEAAPEKWGGKWANGYVYTYGEKIADGECALMKIALGANATPAITTCPVAAEPAALEPVVIGTDTLQDWSDPVTLEKDGDVWTLPEGRRANFFKVVFRVKTNE